VETPLLAAANSDLGDLRGHHRSIAANLAACEFFNDRIWATAAKDRETPIQMFRWTIENEELHAICVGAAIRHTKQTASVVRGTGQTSSANT